MKNVFPLSLLLLACLALGACGSQQDAAAPMPTDGGDEAQIQLDPSDPLANYLNLSQLPQETLSACTQALNQTSENGGVTAKLHKVMGDAMTLYLSLELTYPPELADKDPRTFGDSITEATLTTADGLATGLKEQVRQIDGNTMSYLFAASFGKEALTPGKEVTLSLSDSLSGGSAHTFQWTVETQGTFRYADLKDDSGTMVGTVILSPFGLTSDVWKTDGLDQQALENGLVLLDQSGKALAPDAAGHGSGEGTLHLEYLFFSPLDPSGVGTVQIGPYAAQFNA